MKRIHSYKSFLNETNSDEYSIKEYIEDVLGLNIENIEEAIDLLDDKLEEDEDNIFLHKLHDDLLLVALDIETSEIIDTINTKFGLNLSLEDETIEETLDIIEDELSKNPNEELLELYNDLIEIYDDITEIESERNVINESRKKRRKSKAKAKRRKKRKSKNTYNLANYYAKPLSLYPYGYYNNIYRPYLLGGYGSGITNNYNNTDNSIDIDNTGTINVGGNLGGGDYSGGIGGGDAGGGE